MGLQRIGLDLATEEQGCHTGEAMGRCSADSPSKITDLWMRLSLAPIQAHLLVGGHQVSFAETMGKGKNYLSESCLNSQFMESWNIIRWLILYTTNFCESCYIAVDPASLEKHSLGLKNGRDGSGGWWEERVWGESVGVGEICMHIWWRFAITFVTMLIPQSPFLL